MQDRRLVVRQAGAPVLLARICEELRIRRIVNAMVTWDPKQWRVTPGTLVVAMILNALVAQKPLYKVPDFYRRRDLALLFAERVQADALNDDALGRTLDRLATIDQTHLVESVALSAVHQGEMEIRSVHADTTSVSVYGEFEPTASDQRFCQEHPDKQLITINHGHSKQRRPDLKQFILGLVVSQDGVPLWGDVRDGSFSDKVWNRQVLEAMHKSFLDPRAVVYVADSSLMTQKNLKALADAKVRFISRLPETFKVTAEVKRQAFAENRWRPVGRLARSRQRGAFYQSISYERTIKGHTFRLVVVRSSALNERKQKKLRRVIEKERKTLLQEVKEGKRHRYNCREDAEAALRAWLDKHREALHPVKGMVMAITETKRPRGRPRKDVDYPRVTTYQLDLGIREPSEEAKQAWLERESAFVLITVLPEETHGDAEILEEYHDQTKVEQGFRLFKHPILADGVFLKSTRRVEAYGYVAMLALLVAAFLQQRVRKALMQRPPSQRKLRLLEGNRKTDRPTSVALLEDIDYIPVIWEVTPEGYGRYLAEELPPEHIEILEMTGYGSEIYLDSLTP